MRAAYRVFGAVCLLGILFQTQVGMRTVARAQDSSRFTTIILPYTEYEWWLIEWANNSVICRVFIDHEGLPTLEEVAADCGSSIASAWVNTPSCNKDVPTECYGVYVLLFATTPKEREVIVELPESAVWVTLEGCSPTPPTNFCPSLPTLVLTGEEPLPDHSILSIQGTYDF